VRVPAGYRGEALKFSEPSTLVEILASRMRLSAFVLRRIRQVWKTIRRNKPLSSSRTNLRDEIKIAMCDSNFRNSCGVDNYKSLWGININEITVARKVVLYCVACDRSWKMRVGFSFVSRYEKVDKKRLIVANELIMRRTSIKLQLYY